jgi:hypothetical protein
MGVMQNLTSFYLDSVLVLVLVQDRCTVFAKRTIGSEIVLTHLMVLEGGETQVKARSV